MKQKIVIKVQMKCGKCRKEAMKIAVSANGVISVMIQGNDKDEIVVVGIGVDSAGICNELRQKVGKAILVSVEEVKDPKLEEKKGGDDQKRKEGDQEKKKTENQKIENKAGVIVEYVSYPEPQYFSASSQLSPQDNSGCSLM